MEVNEMVINEIAKAVIAVINENRYNGKAMRIDRSIERLSQLILNGYTSIGIYAATSVIEIYRGWEMITDYEFELRVNDTVIRVQY